MYFTRNSHYLSVSIAREPFSKRVLKNILSIVKKRIKAKDVLKDVRLSLPVSHNQCR